MRFLDEDFWRGNFWGLIMKQPQRLPFLPALVFGVMFLLAQNGLAQTPYEAERAAVARLTGEKVELVKPTRFAPLLEVVTEKGIYYTDPGAHFLLVGANVVDLKTRENLTAIRRNRLDTIDFKDLPLADAIKTVRGNGSRVMAVFSDLNCGYCKRLEQDLQGLDDATVYTFMIGLLSKESAEQEVSVWCAADRVQAWRQAMTGGPALAPISCDRHPIARNTALSKKIRVAG